MLHPRKGVTMLDPQDDDLLLTALIFGLIVIFGAIFIIGMLMAIKSM